MFSRRLVPLGVGVEGEALGTSPSTDEVKVYDAGIVL